jgi:putative membrane protein
MFPKTFGIWHMLVSRGELRQNRNARGAVISSLNLPGKEGKMKILLRIVINAVAIWLTTLILPNFSFGGEWWRLLIVAVIFGLVNALIRPIVKLLTLPINIVTLGLFSLVINALMLLIVVWISGSLSLEGNVFQNLITVFIAAIIISVISTVLSWFLPD